MVARGFGEVSGHIAALPRACVRERANVTVCVCMRAYECPLSVRLLSQWL